jgi:hypothetical protein
LYRILWQAVPGASALRAGGRVQVVTNGFVVAVVAIALARLLLAIAPGARLAIWGVVLLCVAEQVNLRRNHHLSRAQELAQLAAVPVPPAACKSFYIVAPDRVPPFVHQTNAMLIAQVANLPTLNGYSGWFPPGWPLWDLGEPSYRRNAWLWAARHGITDGLCEYHIPPRRWLQPPAEVSIGAPPEPETVR